ncbi:hypothetical protein RRG08_041810 [Elysia crispata]|uniref:Uncharacterized protein n=1 Tax=Elysia crispata TaxID=231223 RepID=A0AAE1D4H1_9GAST|nr:hypothetical protein RRG08_041810 [Elysia crispata]
MLPLRRCGNTYISIVAQNTRAVFSGPLDLDTDILKASSATTFEPTEVEIQKPESTCNRLSTSDDRDSNFVQTGVQQPCAVEQTTTKRPIYMWPDFSPVLRRAEKLGGGGRSKNGKQPRENCGYRYSKKNPSKTNTITRCRSIFPPYKLFLVPLQLRHKMRQDLAFLAVTDARAHGV